MKTLLASGVLLCLSTCAFAQANPDFSGEWTLNHDESKFGENYRPPAKWVDSVRHKDPELVIDRLELTDAGKRTAMLRYTTDGTECSNSVVGNPVKSTVKWDAQALKFHHVSKFKNADITLDDKWMLSPDGKKLLVTRHFEGQGISANQTIVFDKTGR
jgi:hypothetical protein